ncbi:NADAR family protein [Gilvimarinus sp. DA14]|uniref:NADAR family protein n=1 Tax=Gilvimarinus sp. DA14 TaxID=2956798 RepID=UPI0020B89095|nr:NADAR family protein [Gilvimarinus sp. DA14]UTF61051.1 NADAR family protein [Gilvimarinus sp. DA14]
MFTAAPEQALYLSMENPDDGLSRVSPHPFELEGKHWPTVEHYYLAMRLIREEDQEKVRQATGVMAARKAAKGWFRKKRGDWKQVQTVVMTRAVYTKMRSYPPLTEKLLATGNETLVEDSQFDYFWGCGRDKRGDNHYGKVLMNVRAKLRDEAQQLAKP